MPTVTLVPGDVFTFVHAGSDIPPVGSPPQWADGLDSTYATSSNDSFDNVDARAFLDAYTFPGTPVSLTYHARLQNTSDPGLEAPLEIGLYDPVEFTFFMLGLDQMLVAQALDSPGWFSTDPIAIPDPGAFANASSAGQISLLCAQEATGLTSTNTSTRIFEAYIVVTYGAGTPPLRRYPRAGISGPSRGTPRRNTRRPGTY